MLTITTTTARDQARIETRAALAGAEDRARAYEAANKELATQMADAQQLADQYKADRGHARNDAAICHSQLQDAQKMLAEATHEVGRLNAELARARVEIRTLKSVPPAAAAGPDKAVMVSVSYGSWPEEPGVPSHQSRDTWTGARKAEVVQDLGPIVDAMQAAGMFSSGIRLALAEEATQFADHGYTPVDPAAHHRLSLARQYLLDTLGIGLLPLPSVVLIYQDNTFMRVLDPQPQPGRLHAWRDDAELR